MVKAPEDLAKHFHWHGDHAEDQQIVDTVTPRRGKASTDRLASLAEPVWNPEEEDHQGLWRAVWQHRTKRAVRDRQTLLLQRNRAIGIIEGDKTSKSVRFVKTSGAARVFDEASYDRAVRLAGWKGYVTNIPTTIMGEQEIVASYHELWHVEQSFRMSKTDLRARPIFHHKQDAIEAHLTMMFTALAISRYLYALTGVTAPKIVKALKPLQDVTIHISGHEITATPKITPQAADLLQTLRSEGH